MFVGSQVRLLVNGVAHTVATDVPTRLHPMFAQLASVSPDGMSLLYVTADAVDMRNTTFTTVNLKTQQKRVIANLGNAFWVRTPHWSPDGSSIMYVRQNVSFAPELWVMSASGVGPHRVFAGWQLTHRSLEGREAMLPQWSSDSKSLIFHDSSYKPTAQYAVNVSTSTLSSQPTPFVVVGGGANSCNVPIYSQRNPVWSGEHMMYQGDTIGVAGCALTSLTMLFNYYGAGLGDPHGMNSCLSPWNYAEPLNWQGAQVNPSTTGPSGPGCDHYTTNWIQQVSFNWSQLDTYLRSGWPVIVGGCYDNPTCNQTHWVIVTAGNNTDTFSGYWINDPWDGNFKQMSNLSNFTYKWMSLYQKASGTWTPCE